MSKGVTRRKWRAKERRVSSGARCLHNNMLCYNLLLNGHEGPLKCNCIICVWCIYRIRLRKSSKF